MAKKGRRGKRPVRADPRRALKPRWIELRGPQKSFFTVPVLYRRSFGWTEARVRFQPVNRRAFIVVRGDVDKEAADPEQHARFTLEISSLPWYGRHRKSSKRELRSNTEELKEALIAASLLDRYVDVRIPKPDDPELYRILRADVESLLPELGCEYGADQRGLLCRFRFTHKTMPELAVEAKSKAAEGLELLRYFSQVLEAKGPAGAAENADDLIYGIRQSEVRMDRLYTDAVNVAWDLPRTQPVGYFLWIQYFEEMLDEAETIAKETVVALELIGAKGMRSKASGKEVFSDIWLSSVRPALDYCADVLDTVTLDLGGKEMERAMEAVRKRRVLSETSGRRESEMLARTLEKGKGGRPDRKWIEASYRLYNIIQSSGRMVDAASDLAAKSLYLGIRALDAAGK